MLCGHWGCEAHFSRLVQFFVLLLQFPVHSIRMSDDQSRISVFNSFQWFHVHHTPFLPFQIWFQFQEISQETLGQKSIATPLTPTQNHIRHPWYPWNPHVVLAESCILTIDDYSTVCHLGKVATIQFPSFHWRRGARWLNPEIKPFPPCCGSLWLPHKFPGTNTTPLPRPFHTAQHHADVVASPQC